MNPEFQRNLWLEVSHRRTVFMVVTLGLLFMAANSTFGTFALRSSAEYAFYAIVVILGARNAAQSVVGEIRDRTWDAQRLSSLSPFAMTWGKLLGATSHAWIGGIICMAVLVWTAFAQGGVGAALGELSYFLMIGLMAQSVALFTSLLAARRRQTHSRLDVFMYQIMGLIAAWSVWSAWKAVSAGGIFAGSLGFDELRWWGLSIDAPLFYLVSLLVFLLWAFIGCLRVMRIELSMQNTPIVWILFVAFMAVYFAGSEILPIPNIIGLEIPSAIRPLLHATIVTALLTYIAVFAEPKDQVLYRWLAKTLIAGQFRLFSSRLQAWMIAYAATLLFGLALMLVLATNPPEMLGFEFFRASAVLSALGLLTRDMAIFLLFPLLPGARRGEAPAVVTLLLLYYVVPPLLSGAGVGALFYPFGRDLGLAGPLIAWGEALVMWFVLYRVAGKGILPHQPALPVSVQPERK
nr:MAG: hypothetical protein E4H34_02565 [Hyphomicrobiales bacterium]